MRAAAIGDLVEPIKSWSPASEPEEMFDYVDLSAISQAEKRIMSATSLQGAEAPSRARQVISVGDILVSTVRPNLNGVAPVTPEYDGATASTGFCVLRPNASKIVGRYLMHWVQSPTFVEQMVRQATGASYPAVSDKIVKASTIPLPPLDEQRRIAVILDKADALRRQRRHALHLLDGLTRSIFLEMFGDADRNRFPVVEMGEVIAEGPNNGLYKPISDYGMGTPILRINNFYDGKITDLDSLRRLTVDDSEIARFELREDDIVINRVNSREYVGKSAIVPALAERTVYESNMMRFRVREDEALPIFIIQALQTCAVQRQIQSKTKDAINQSSINQKDVRSLRIVLPPIVEQRRFAQAVQFVATTRSVQRNGEGGTHALFTSLQHRAFTGQL